MHLCRPLLCRCCGVRRLRPIAVPIALLAGLASQSIAAPRKAAPSSPVSAPVQACRPGEPSFFRDEGLSIKVATKLQFSKALLREKVDVKVTGGVAMLSGGMSSAAAIAAAVQLASQVQGITCVDNRLKVGPPETTDHEPTRP
jgi:hyperosmotically inducible protein